jgi:predicted transposase/invertase (TIGR01784 family)
MTRYINPYTDFGFKKLFGEDVNKDLLIDFLNAVLPAERQIASLSFQNPENLPDLPTNRYAIFDIACQSVTGEHFIVEMQKVAQHYFRDRSVFYSTFPIRKQAPKGDWDFNLQRVYFVAILNFCYDIDEDKQKFMREVTLKDQDGDTFYDKLTYYFFQMPHFLKTESELVTQKDKWFYFLKNLDGFDDIPAILREPIFERAFDMAEYIHLPEKEQDRYERDLKIYRDNYAAMKTAIDTGYTKGLAKGEAKGKLEGKIEMARNMKAKGFAVKDIADITGLSVKKIEKIK